MASLKLSTEIVPTEDVSNSEELADITSTLFNDHWHIYTLADAYRPRPPVQYIVHELLSLPSLTIFYGRPGTLKSLFLKDLAACVASGLDWLPPLRGEEDTTRATIQSPVLWLDFDGGMRRTSERLDAIGHARNIQETAPLFYVSMPTPWLNISNKTHIENLAQRFRLLGIRLCVIDNLGAVKGNTDENSSDMAQLMSQLRWLVETTHSALVALAHPRKDNGMTSNLGDLLRGHSSILASVDLALIVEQDASDRSRIIVRSAKSRDADIPPFGAKFQYRQKPGTTELAWVKFFGFHVDDTQGSKTIQTKILLYLSRHGISSQTRIVDDIRKQIPSASEHRVRAVLDILESENKVLTSKGSRQSKLYDLPQTLANQQVALIRRLLESSQSVSE